MRITDQLLREKLIDFLQGKKEVSTGTITTFASAWAGDSKIRLMLNGLAEEEVLTLTKENENGRAKALWTLVVSEPPATKPVVSEKVENVIHKESVMLVEPNKELHETLKHEFNITLRKQQRRRDWAGKILQNAEGVIKVLEKNIKELS